MGGPSSRNRMKCCPPTRRRAAWMRALLLVITVSLFGAQLAYTRHEYTHLKAPGTLRVCQYCMAGTHMQSLSPADVLRLPAGARFERPHVHVFIGIADASPETVRLRGPPPVEIAI